MPSPYHAPLSLTEKLTIIPSFLTSLSSTLFALLLSPFHTRRAPLKKHLLLHLMRAVFSRLSARQLQSLTGPSKKSYSAWCAAHGITPRILTIPPVDGKGEPVEAFWLGPSDAKSIVLYVHGGGWTMPLSPGHIEFPASIISSAPASSLAVLLLSQPPSTDAPYPAQLRDAAALLRHVLSPEGLARTPGDVILHGDSAGGNMVLALLYHILTPHPDIAPLRLEGPLKGVVACSPLVGFELEDASRDVFDPVTNSVLRSWVSSYAGAESRDQPWAQPVKIALDGWKGLENVVAEVLVTGAKDEGIAGDIAEVGKAIKSAHAQTTVFFGAEDFHAQPNIGLDAGLGSGEAGEVIKKWVLARV